MEDLKWACSWRKLLVPGWVFSSTGLMTAVFNADGIWPPRREWFMISVMNGEMAEVFAFSRAEGKGSRA